MDNHRELIEILEIWKKKAMDLIIEQRKFGDEKENLLQYVIDRMQKDHCRIWIIEKEPIFLRMTDIEKYWFLSNLKHTFDNDYLLQKNCQYWEPEKKYLIYKLLHYYQQLKTTEIKNEVETFEGRDQKLNYLRRELKAHIQILNYSTEKEPDTFHKFLNTEIEYWQNYIEPKQLTETPTEQDDKIIAQTTTKQKILILHYLGILSLDISQKTKGKLFSYLLDRHEKNIKDPITYFTKKSIHNPNTEKNLKKVLEIFTELHLNDYAKQVEKDLDKLRTKKIQ